MAEEVMRPGIRPGGQDKMPLTTFPCTGCFTQSHGILPCFAWRPQVAGRVPGIQPGGQDKMPLTTFPCTSVSLKSRPW